MKPFLRFLLVVCALGVLALPGMHAQSGAVPPDLKPLLAAPVSEMRLVATRYRADRQTLNANYAGAGGFNMPGARGGRGAAAEQAAPAPRPVPISAARLARLKRYGLDWQAALDSLSPARLSPAAASDLAALKAAIAADLTQLETENLELAQITPAVPFAAQLVALVEARLRVDDVDGQQAAATLTDVTRQIAAAIAAPPNKINAASAARAADATDTLRAAMTEWFSFYNGYDPVFTWWMGVPYKQVDKALQDYAGFLRDKASDAAVAAAPASVLALQAASAPKVPSVPDLAEILALPQDEMRDIVARFNAQGPRPAGRGGPAPEVVALRSTRRTPPRFAGRGPTGAARFIRPSRQPRLAGGAVVAGLRPALAQCAGRLPVHQVAGRHRHRAPDRNDSGGPGVPRRRIADPGEAARPRGPHRRPARQHDPVHARAAHRARQPRVRLVRERDEEGLAGDGLRRRLEAGDREGQAGRGPAGRRSRA